MGIVRMQYVLAIVAAATVLSACGGSAPRESAAGTSSSGAGTSQAQTAKSADSPSRMLVDYELPSATLHDWVTSAEMYATFVLISAEERPVPPAERESEHQLVPIELRLRIDSVLWLRPGAPPPSAEFAFETIGWTRSGDEQSPVLVNNSPEWIEGARYVGPLHFFIESGTWEPIDPGTLGIVRADGSIDVPTSEYDSESVAQMQSRGRTPAEVAAELEQAAT
jgi:hypothetical protein